MKKILFLLFPIISFAQNQNEIKAIEFQNTVRFYNFLKPLVHCDTLSTNAQEWAEHLALIDNIRISKDFFGENVYSVRKISETIAPNFNHAIDAVVFWATTSKDALDQIIDPNATKVGFGISENKYKYFIVAKYNNIIE